jgi:hypothetical protein
MKRDEKLGRHLVRERSGGVCEANIGNACLGYAHSVHHRKNRSQGGSWAVSNLLHTCGDGVRGCHGWITEHPAFSYARGWAVRRALDPAEVPVRYRDGQVYLLANDGGMSLYAEEEL